MDSGWISASAGAGKTSIIVDRVINLILLGVKSNKILLVTLTNNASKELDERIRKKISFLLNLNASEFFDFLKKKFNYTMPIDRESVIYRLQDALLAKEYSSTIHAYCFKSIKKFAKFFSTDFLNIKIKNDFLIKANIKEIVDKVIFSDDISQNEELLDFIYDVGLGRVSYLIVEIVRIYRKICFFNDSEKLNDLILSNLIDKDNNLQFFDINEIFLNSKISLKLLKNSSGAIIDHIFEFFDSEFSRKDIQKYINLFITKEGKPKNLRFNKSICDTLKKSILEEQDRVIVIINKINSYLIASDTIKIMSIARLVVYKLNCESTLGFNELIDIYSNMLSDSSIGQNIAYDFFLNYDHFIIDEAQDLTSDQWKIVNLLMENFFVDGKSFFCVGDPKQSIYGFLGAKSDFFALYKDIICNIAKNSGASFREENLDVSYRSSKKIIEFINNIFEGKKIGCDVRRHFSASKNYGNVYIMPVIDICSKQYASLEYQDAKAACYADFAKNIVTEIKKIQKSNNGGIAGKDIMILIRKRSDFSDTVAMTLLDYGIDFNYDCQDYSGLLNEISFIIDIARFIIIGDIASAIGILSIFNERIEILNYFEKNSEDFKCQKFKNYCDNSKALFLMIAKYSFCDSFKKLFAEIFFAFDDIIFFKKNERLFFEFCDIAEKDDIFSIFDFVSWFDSYGSNAINYINFNYNYNSNDSVKIMTIHAAKGMQSDFVFVLDDGDFPKMDSNKIYYRESNDYQIMPFFVREKYFMSDKIISFFKKDKVEIEEEYKRLLYVALTRAKSNLFFAAIKKNNSHKCWYSFICEALNNKIDDYLLPVEPKPPSCL